MSDFKISANFEIENIDFELLSKSAAKANEALAAQIERLCEKAKAMGPNICLAVAPMRQNPRTLGYEFPYGFIEAGAPVDREWRIYGPWPSPISARNIRD